MWLRIEFVGRSRLVLVKCLVWSHSRRVLVLQSTMHELGASEVVQCRAEGGHSGIPRELASGVLRGRQLSKNSRRNGLVSWRSTFTTASGGVERSEGEGEHVRRGIEIINYGERSGQSGHSCVCWTRETLLRRRNVPRCTLPNRACMPTDPTPRFAQFGHDLCVRHRRGTSSSTSTTSIPCPPFFVDVVHRRCHHASLVSNGSTAA